MSTYILSALLSLPLKIFEIREPREDGPGAEVWWHRGATSDRRWHRPVQQAALSAQAEHHGSHCECSQAATGSAACNIGHFMVFLSYTTKNKQLLLSKGWMQCSCAWAWELMCTQAGCCVHTSAMSHNRSHSLFLCEHFIFVELMWSLQSTLSSALFINSS